MDEPTTDIALLTPVPKQHLLSGLEKVRTEGFVAFGTDATMVLSELKSLVDQDHPADILFYASHSTDAGDAGPPKATFRGRFVAYEGAIGGKAMPAWVKYRPVSTATDTSWTSFYLVSDLRPFDQPISITTLKKRDNKGKFSKTFVPLGPIIIDTPF